MLQVGILGLGAIGHLVAAQLLEKSGLHLHFFNRSNRTRFRFKSHLGRLVDKPVECHTRPAAFQLDWLLACLKTYHYTAAEPWFQQLIQPTTRVVVLRNGLDLGAPLLPYSSAAMILPTLVDGPTQFNDTTKQYEQLAPARLILPPHPLSESFQTLLEGSDVQVSIATDFKTASWEKLIESAALGAITCLTGATCQIFRNENIKQLYRQLLDEGIQVARADGAQLSQDLEERLLEKVVSYPPEKGSSMLTDRLAGRPIEVMAKNGIISQKGKDLGVSTPLNDSFTALLQHINRKE